MIDIDLLYKNVLDLGIIDEPLLKECFDEAKETGVDFGELLLERDLISDENLGVVMADLYKVPFVRLSQTKIEKELLMMVPEEMARAQGVVLFKKDEEGYHLALLDPRDEVIGSFLDKRFDGKNKFYYATKRDIASALFGYRRDVAEVFEEIITDSANEAEGMGGENEAPIVRLVEAMMEYAYQSRASDVHVEPMEDKTLVRFRVDGVLHDVVALPKRAEDQVISRIKILSSLPTDEHASALDGKFEFEVAGYERVDVRVSIVPSTKGERVVMRLLAGDSRQFALLDLGFGKDDIEKVRHAYSKPYGMILATGPTGSGKTTTMYALLKIMNKRNVNIMTIEDPVEYQIRGVNQIQVNPKTNLTFAAGLKSIVRQDPNIILVGEVRDEETAGIAVNASLTGHLVLSTLHTSDAATTIPRLLDMGVEPFLLSSSVNLIVAQRLVRKICVNCRKSEVMEGDELKEIDSKLLSSLEKSGKGYRVYRGEGCEVCRNTGYVGRVGIYEVMEMTDKVREAIMKKENADEIKKIAQKEGMTSMFDDGMSKVRLGITTIEELLRVIKE